MRFYKNPKWFKWLYPGAIWDFFYQDDRSIYLTFDDGPNPVTTPYLLELLDQYNAKATFFCLGKQVKQYPDLFKTIRDKGHQVGNHGMEHLNGIKTTLATYLENVEQAAELIPSRLYRPPYGKIKPKQFKALQKKGYTVAFWSVMAYDFDADLSSEKRITKMKDLTKNGAIFVFHDSEKCLEVLKNDLPKLMEFWKEEQYSLKTLPGK
ncbi:MAG: polysaccharide deacetylase family protein [Crocinitomicaceae bacterium]|nr:polysaccharide deacetylase family protein [Crocinitomicaceae bacterium]